MQGPENKQFLVGSTRSSLVLAYEPAAMQKKPLLAVGAARPSWGRQANAAPKVMHPKYKRLPAFASPCVRDLRVVAGAAE